MFPIPQYTYLNLFLKLFRKWGNLFMVLLMLTGKMFHNSLPLVVRKLSLILRLVNTSVLSCPFNSDPSTHFLGFYPFDMQIAAFSFFTILSDFVFLLLLEVNKLISPGFPLVRSTHLFLASNSWVPPFWTWKAQTIYTYGASRLWMYIKHTLQSNVTSYCRGKNN